ncbi:2-oxoacid:acceptor oxidoreductase family protein [Nitrososphaera sp.]|uniref:2-oxoacid:acceptor oxidoreductase family protein n=1 Tax=Nitrososphaera sp. TaxID=1971748 RepID=UPI00307D2C4F
MISVRLAGRGGQGIKSAAHIVGSAAFIGGHYVQDQPLYGAERRGAPITAFIRISNSPILERGPVVKPTVVVIADDSLLADESFDVLEGISSKETAAVLVNTAKDEKHLVSSYGINSKTVIAADLSRVAEEILERPIVGVAVACAAGRLLGQDLEDLEQALVQELENIRVMGESRARNLELARRVYWSFEPVENLEAAAGGAGDNNSDDEEEERKRAQTFIELRQHGPETSACSIVSPANTRERRVGTWSRFKPVINYEDCTKCRICFVYCPDSAILIGKDDFPVVDYDACKGCNICLTECPVDAISLVKREKAVESL